MINKTNYIWWYVAAALVVGLLLGYFIGYRDDRNVVGQAQGSAILKTLFCGDYCGDHGRMMCSMCGCRWDDNEVPPCQSMSPPPE